MREYKSSIRQIRQLVKCLKSEPDANANESGWDANSNRLGANVVESGPSNLDWLLADTPISGGIVHATASSGGHLQFA